MPRHRRKTQLNLSVDSALKENFAIACADAGRSMASVMSELMKAYLDGALPETGVINSPFTPNEVIKLKELVKSCP